MSQPYVLIVGAGPTGLAMAAELMRFSISFRIIDNSSGPAEWSQALVVQARASSSSSATESAESAVEQGKKLEVVRIFSDRREVLELDLSRVRSRYPFALSLPQKQTEQILIDHLASNGVEVERNVALTTLAQDPQSVSCTLALADGEAQTC